VGSYVLVCDLGEPQDGELTARLSHCGFVVERVSDVEGSLAGLYSRPASAVMIRVSDGAARDLCRSLRRLSDVPIVVLCARADEGLVVSYLESGADRVLSGSPSRRELQARIGAVIAGRRLEGRGAPGPRVCTAGDLRIEAKGHKVHRNGHALSLTPTEFRLLFALARRGGGIVTHRELLAEAWGAEGSPSPESLRHYIRYLRQKLGDSSRRSRLILNHRGVGYRLVTDAA
jgi:two-component system KDP operon response regulator KdpE